MQEKFLDINQPLPETLEEILKLEELCNTLTQKSKDINEYQKTLDMDISPFDYVEEVKVSMLYRARLWRSLHEWGTVLVDKWRTAPFELVDVAEISQKAEQYTKTAL